MLDDRAGGNYDEQRKVDAEDGENGRKEACGISEQIDFRRNQRQDLQTVLESKLRRMYHGDAEPQELSEEDFGLTAGRSLLTGEIQSHKRICTGSIFKS